MRYEYPCETKTCHKNSTRTAQCSGCGKKHKFCAGCFTTFVADSDECREKWRAEAAKGLPAEKLPQPANVRPKKPKGYEVYQKELS